MNSKHAARLREMAQVIKFAGDMPDKEAMLVGAAALEGKGRWYVSDIGKQAYLIPCDRWEDWEAWSADREVGEHTAIVPAWALAVPPNVVITGVELP